MAKKKETKQSPMQRLFVYAGKYKYLTIASWILAAISAFVALVPFYFIWRIIKEVLYVAPNYADAENLSAYGWSAVGFAILSMLIYIGALICSAFVRISRTGKYKSWADETYFNAATWFYG